MFDINPIKQVKVTKSAKQIMVKVAAGADVDLVSHKVLGAKRVVINLGKNSKLTLLIVRNNRRVIKENWQFVLAEGSQLQQVLYFNNQGQYLMVNQTKMTGKKSVSQVLLANKNSAAGQLTVQLDILQQAKETNSSMTIKALSQDLAQGRILALDRIAKTAAGSDAQIKEEVLNLSTDGQVVVQPNLEILNNDVTAGHSATLGNVDEQAVKYLTARGLDGKQVQALLVRGFFKPLLAEINSPKIKTEFCQLIS